MPVAAEPQVSRSHVVRGDERDERGWIRESPLCPLLAQHHIAHVGVLEATEPFQMSRPDQSGTFMLACFGGLGCVSGAGRV